MKQWHIKEMSHLTQVSVRMLRHYDKIGLLTPSFREANGYRCYTEPDLMKLQQIIALKYFGFSLNDIKEILSKHKNLFAHLQAQHQVLRKEVQHLQTVCQVIDQVLKHQDSSTHPDWKDMLRLIEGYQMTETLREKLRESWAGEHLTASQFESYLYLYEKFPTEFSERDKMIEDINAKKVGDANGPDGERIASFMKSFQKKMKAEFSTQAKFGSSLLKSMQSGQLRQFELNPDGIRWISEAMLHQALKEWDTLYAKILENLEASPESELGKQVANQWRYMVNEQLEMGNPDYVMGLMLWQSIARQQHDLKEQESYEPQAMIKPWHLDIMFNPEATSWVCQALEAHQ